MIFQIYKINQFTFFQVIKIQLLDPFFKKLNIKYIHILMQVYKLINLIMVMEYLKNLALNAFLTQKIRVFMILLELCYQNYTDNYNQLIILGETMGYSKDLTNLNLLIPG